MICGPRVPDAGLIAQAGGKIEWNEAKGAFLPTVLPPHVTAVGDAAGENIVNTGIRFAAGKRAFVCLCSDVSSKDLCDGIAEGFDQIETLEALYDGDDGSLPGTHVPVVGHRSLRARNRPHVRADRRDHVAPAESRSDAGSSGWSAASSRSPTPRCTMRTTTLGAVWMDMGDWKRPRYYTRSFKRQ